MFAALLPILGPLLGDLLKRVIPDPDAQRAAEQELRLALLEKAGEISDAAGRIIEAEAKSTHWLTATWRPILMLTITAIIANNYILAPYLEAIIGRSIMLPLPPELWQLLTVGVGGYVVGRSAEKVVENWKAKP